MNKGGYNRILEANYDENEQISMITKAGKYGTFTAFSHVHPEDIDYANYWDGLTITEYKVDSMILQEKAKMYRQRAEGAKMVLDYLDMAGVCLDDPVYQKVAKCVSVMSRDYNIAYNRYQNMRNGFHDFVDTVHRERKSYEKHAKELKSRVKDEA